MAGFTKEATVDFDFWNDVYGFSMKEVAAQQLNHALSTAIVKHIEYEHVGTTECEILRLDLCKCTVRDTKFSTDFELKMLDSSHPRTICGIALWFDAEFSKRFCKENPVSLSTSPKTAKTHWLQTALHFQQPLRLDGSSSSGIFGRVSMVKSSENLRGYDISLEVFPVDGLGKSCGRKQTQLYRS